MLKVRLSANFEDDRGTITDLIAAKVDAVTLVRSNAGAIRGNHLHPNTTQWAYLLSGRLKIATPDETVIAEAGDLVRNEMGEPHAWEALEDTVCVVFVQGPRAGDAYESDTFRLDTPILA